MRDFRLIDAVIELHSIARLVEEAIGVGDLSVKIRGCADTLHSLSLQERKNSVIVNDIINKAKGQE